MKIEILSARLIRGIHYAEHEIVEVAEDLARYLCGVGVAVKATADKKALQNTSLGSATADTHAPASTKTKAK